MTTIPVPAPHLLNAREAASALRLSARKLWELSATGELASVRIGSRRLYEPAALADFIARCRAKAEGGAR